MDKNKAIEKIIMIQGGSGIDRSVFPNNLKGRFGKKNWDDEVFTLGIEYGAMIVLMDAFEITEHDITHYGVRYKSDNWKEDSKIKYPEPDKNYLLRQSIAHLIDALEYHVNSERGYSDDDVMEKIKIAKDYLFESVDKKGE